MILGRVRNENRYLLVIRASRSQELEIEAVITDYFGIGAVNKVKNTSANDVEMIYEMDKKTYYKMYKKDKNITDRLYEIEGVEYVNIVAQSDEVTG